MIETNLQPQQQQNMAFQPQQPFRPEAEAKMPVETGPIITCPICDAVYAPSPQQVPFLQYTQGAVEATFMGMCHFCFRCRRAACPQCWDEVHGVCGSCVQEAGLPFRAGATPLDGLVFPPPAQPSFIPAQQTISLFVPLRTGRFSSAPVLKPEPAHPDINTDHPSAVQPAVAQTVTTDSQRTDGNQSDPGNSINKVAGEPAPNTVTARDQVDTPAAVAIPTKTPRLEDSRASREQEKALRTAKKARKASRLELVLTWIVLVIVLALVVVIALAEFIPAVNVLVVRLVHIDIHAEIAYLVHIVQQLFKR